MRVRRPDDFASSPRRLTLNHSRRLWNERTGKPKDGPVIPNLNPGEEQLFSFYQPGLFAGAHTIKVKQVLSIDPRDPNPSQKRTLNSQQAFNVIQPQYSLPKDAIHSFYPPHGHADEARILPHVLLTDPLLPWEREATLDKTAPDYALNHIPWLALLVFTLDEIKLNAQELNGHESKNTGCVRLDFASLKAKPMSDLATTPVDLTSNPKQVADFVFIKAQAFKDLFADYNAEGGIKYLDRPCLKRYKYLAHARHVNMQGTASSSGGDDDIGLFGVVMAHRTGPWDCPTPTNMVAHLVSIENVDTKVDLSTPQPRVALCSLYSWTYTVLPENSLNLFDAMTHLTTTMDVLRAPSEAFQPLLKSLGLVDYRVGLRMQDGYTLANQRAQTGEATVALVRGPFVPTTVPFPLSSSWDRQSTFATDLQILDKDLGIMDISYSLAWQLGKSMAIADMAFASALSRLRTSISNGAMQMAMKDILSGENVKFRTGREELASGIAESMDKLRNLPDQVASGKCKPADPSRRWKRQQDAGPNMNFWSKEIRERFVVHAKTVAKELGLSTMDHPDGSGKKMLYNEQNAPASTDWAIVLGWLLDRFFFVGIPAHYLIPDTCYLPRESLRFFAIDANWVDALIDGALSVANHTEGDQDSVRSAIKDCLGDFLKGHDPVLGYKPFIPTAGFLMRSQVVKKFPDLKVEAPRVDPRNPSPELLRHEIIAGDTMIVLFDRLPSTDEVPTLAISQPPHQQRFAAADNVGPDSLQNNVVFELNYKYVYTAPYSQWPPPPDKRPPPQIWYPDGPSPVFDFTRRSLIFSNFADNVYNYLTKNMTGPGFSEVFPSAALMGYQLNDPLLVMRIEHSESIKEAFRGGSDFDKIRKMALVECRNRFGTGSRIEEWRKRSSLAVALHASTYGSKGPHHSRHPHHAHHKPHRSHRHGKKQLHEEISPSQYPHFRSLRLPPKLSIPAIPSGSLGFLRPQYTVTISSRDQLRPQPNYITRLESTSDLIFSVTKNKGTSGSDDWRIWMIEVVIPVGPTTEYMMKPYWGFGGSMLSNLRFNPLAAQNPISVKNHTYLLTIQLWPRAVQRWTVAGKSRQAGFILSEATMNQFEEEKHFTFVVKEHYYPTPDNPYGGVAEGTTRVGVQGSVSASTEEKE